MNKIIEFVKIRKEFLNGNIIANNDVSFYINEGEIHAIAGENGAGKSTLVTMLFGLHKPTSGSIIVRGKAIKYNSAMDAIKDGMGMVHQHFQLVDKFTVAENIVLGNEHYHLSLEEIKSLKRQIKNARKNKKVDNKKYKIKINFLKQMLKNSQEQKFVKNEIKKIVDKLKQKNIIYKTEIQTFKKKLKLGKTTKYGFLKRYKINSQINKLSGLYNFNLKAKDKISTLTVGQEQKVEILKLVYKKSDILIFDEPTSMLTPSEIDQLLDIILKFKKEGKTIIIITHKLDEIKRIADRVSVLRKGHYIGTESVKNITSSQLSKMMVGYDIAALKSNKNKLYSDHTVLEVKNLSVKKRKINKLTNINFSVKSGEIVAIAGVEGNGQTELVHAITGLENKYEGSILVNKFALEKLSINKRNRLLSHIPEDRHKYGMILDLKSYENVILKELKKYSK